MSSGIKEGVFFTKEKINSVVFLSSSLKRCYTETRGIQSVCVYLGEVRYYIPVLRCWCCKPLHCKQGKSIDNPREEWRIRSMFFNRGSTSEELLPQCWVEMCGSIYYICIFFHQCKLLTPDGRFSSARVLPQLLVLKQASTWGGLLTWAVQQVKLKNDKGPKIYE